MASEKESKRYERSAVVSDELGARGYVEDFCVNEGGLWTHPVDPQIQVFLSKGSVAFTALSPKIHGEAYQVICDFDAQKVHFLSTYFILASVGRGTILAATSAVGYTRHTEDLKNLIGVISHYCGTPKRHEKPSRKTNLLSLLMGGGSGN